MNPKKRKPGRSKGSKNKVSHGNFETGAKILETGKMTIHYSADQPESKLYEIIGRLYVESQIWNKFDETAFGEASGKCAAPEDKK